MGAIVRLQFWVAQCILTMKGWQSPVTKKQFAKGEYEKKRKAFTDQKLAKWLKEAALNTEKVASFTGFLHLTLQTMAEVEKSRLKVGHTFPDN